MRQTPYLNPETSRLLWEHKCPLWKDRRVWRAGDWALYGNLDGHPLVVRQVSHISNHSRERLETVVRGWRDSVLLAEAIPCPNTDDLLDFLEEQGAVSFGYVYYNHQILAAYNIRQEGEPIIQQSTAVAATRLESVANLVLALLDEKAKDGDK